MSDAIAAASSNSPAAGTRRRSLTAFANTATVNAAETRSTIPPKCRTSSIGGAYPPSLADSFDVPATVVVGAQWGDEGKGKIVDLLALDSDLVCRYQGGPNAGHTIVVGEETFKIRQIPSGVIRGKTCVIGAGCVLDPEVFLGEVDELESRGHATSDVHVSGEAHLIMPWHVALDQASERRLGKLQIGTTRRGIGPCYADKAARLGIRVQDVLDAKILRQKIEVALAEKNVWLERVYGAEPLALDELAEQYESYAQRLRPYVADTSLLVDRALHEGRSVLLEGGQGTLLDLDHGTYPFVTSSSTIAANAATGVGIGPNRIDRVIGVAKAYVTRVGEGPFPTEIEGPDQQRVQKLGGEFGTVTGRTRRCGWLDLVALRYAVRLNGITSLALTKLDVLSSFSEVPVCVAYRLRDGSESDEFPAHQSDFHHCEPVYETLPGWQTPIDDGLPDAARAYVEFVEQELGVEISLVGTGAERERVVALR
jgi:adenylosuccinate synthase